MHEMVYTSAPKTLEADGLGVVARTDEIPKNLEQLMRRLNRFDFSTDTLAGMDQNRFSVVSHCLAEVSGQRWHLITRNVPRKSTDYTKRKTFLVHHIAVTDRELANRTVFDLLGAKSNFLNEWDAAPTILTGRQLKVRRSKKPDLSHWENTSLGRSGLRQLLDWSNHFDGPVFLLGDSPEQISQMFETAIGHIDPAKRNSITFMTAMGSELSGVSFNWIGLIRGTKIASHLANTSTAKLLDTNRSCEFTPSESPRANSFDAPTASFSNQKSDDDGFIDEYATADLNPVAKVRNMPHTSPSKLQSNPTQSSTPPSSDSSYIPPPPKEKGRSNLLSIAAVCGAVLFLGTTLFTSFQWYQSTAEINELESEKDSLNRSLNETRSTLESNGRTLADALGTEKRNLQKAEANLLETQTELDRLQSTIREAVNQFGTGANGNNDLIEGLLSFKRKKEQEAARLIKLIQSYRSNSPLDSAIIIDVQAVERPLEKSFYFDKGVIIEARQDEKILNVVNKFQDGEGETQSIQIEQGSVAFSEDMVTLKIEPDMDLSLRPVEILIKGTDGVEQTLYLIFTPKMPSITQLADPTDDASANNDIQWDHIRTALAQIGETSIHVEKIKFGNYTNKLDQPRSLTKWSAQNRIRIGLTSDDLFNLSVDINQRKEAPLFFLSPPEQTEAAPGSAKDDESNLPKGDSNLDEPTNGFDSVSTHLSGHFSFQGIPAILFGDTLIQELKEVPSDNDDVNSEFQRSGLTPNIPNNN